MRNNLLPSLAMILVLSALLGGVYPAFIGVAGQMLFPEQAQGSLIVKNDTALASRLIGYAAQDKIGYFHFRPSQATLSDRVLVGGASNLAQSNPVLRMQFSDRLQAWKGTYPNDKPVPVEMLFASGGGLDPNISVASAEQQGARIAMERGVEPEKIAELIERHKRTIPLLRLSFVNAVELNFALDELP